MSNKDDLLSNGLFHLTQTKHDFSVLYFFKSTALAVREILMNLQHYGTFAVLYNRLYFKKTQCISFSYSHYLNNDYLLLCKTCFSNTPT